MLSDDVLRLIAVGTLVVWGTAFAVMTKREYGKTQYSFLQFPIWCVFIVYTRIIWRARVVGQIDVAPGQGAIIVSNHVSSVDPLFIQLTSHKVVRWLVAREYSLDPKLKWIFRILGSIPVNRRGVDTAATKMAIRLARQGEKVGLFPEGQINTTDDLLLPGRPGVAMIALRARVPVVPCFVFNAPYDGTAFGCFLMTARTTVVIGKPIDLSPYYDREGDRDALVDVTKLVLCGIANLAGVSDYEPQIAGRRWKKFGVPA